jgi:phosphate starvation-inducible PhoH-like protein
MSKKKQRYPQPLSEDTVQSAVSLRGRPIKIRHKIQAKNYSQEQYLECLRTSPLTIGEGPAGSGKTYLVTAVALEKLINKEVDKIVITRPVVESDEKLGFLPGTLEEKLDPYLRPLYDAIEDHIGPVAAKALLENGKIEIAPLAYMRGRTFNNAYVILDEAQNATVKQMKMFLTRLGFNAFACIDGDVTQSDLAKPHGHIGPWEHGLEYAIRKLVGKSAMIQLTKFTNRDIVRSELVQEIVGLLEAPDERREPIDSAIKTNGQATSPALFSQPTHKVNGHAAQ